MNSVNIIGNITKDIKLTYTSNNKAFTRFTVAVNDGRDRTQFIPCIAWEKVAENMKTYLQKGSKVGVSGNLQSGSYEKDGVKIFTLDVVAYKVEFINNKQEEPTMPVVGERETIDISEDMLPF